MKCRSPARALPAALFMLIAGLTIIPPLAGAPAHPHPCLMPPAEKQRLLDRIRSNEAVRRQFESIKARAGEGKFGEAALAFALEGDRKFSEVARRHLLKVVRERTRNLDKDIAAGGHREGNMEFYWDTAEIRAYDLVYPALSPEDRNRIETFYRKLGHYWKDSLSRWTTTPNLTFPIHYHAAVVGFCLDDAELIEWGLRDSGGKFGAEQALRDFPLLARRRQPAALRCSPAMHQKV